MKQRLTLIIALLSLLALLMACNNAPGAVATLAPTAMAPVENTLAPATRTTIEDAPTEASQVVDAPTEVAIEVIADTPTPEPTPTEAATPTPAPPTVYSYRILNTYPHDPAAFTQGLVFDGGALYEGTGRWGESTVRQVALETGAVLRMRPLEAQYFGEGITILGDRLYQLTWQEQTGFIYDKNTFEPLQTFTYPHEGWGITQDGTRLIVSDGTPTIRFWDPDTLQEIGQITVRDHEGPVNRLNELEYINGEIWANIWLTDLIARISPETGDVVGYVDLSGLLDTSALAQPADVLNGIAFDGATGRLFVTGKLWPSLFEIEVVP